MRFLRKSIKAYIISAVIFVLLSLILACIICFSGFKESWTFAGLILILSADALFLGIIQGFAAGKRGVLTGILSEIMFLFMIIIITGCIFADTFDLKDKIVFYMIPVFMGGIGGLIGTGRCID